MEPLFERPESGRQFGSSVARNVGPSMAHDVSMSLARPVLPGRLCMVTRRCSERRFFMLPDGDTTNAFLYCLGYAATRSEVGVVFFMACSNHYRAGILDHRGRLPEFLECFHKLFAKHDNARFGR